jgi:hypothetical protein
MPTPRGILCALACLAAACAGCARTACWHWPSYEPPLVASGSSRLEMARLGEQIGRTDLATRFYQDVLERDPGNAVAHHRLGAIAAKEGRWGEADEHFAEAQRLGGLNAELLTDIAQAQYDRKQWRCAERNLRRALEQEPENAKSRSLLALVLGEQGKHRESMAQFREVVRGSDAKADVENIVQQLAAGGRDMQANAQHRTREQLAAAGVKPGSAPRTIVDAPEVDELSVIVQRPPAAKPQIVPHRPRPVPTNPPQVTEASHRAPSREASRPAAVPLMVKQSRETNPRSEPLADHKAVPVEAHQPRSATKVSEARAPAPAFPRPSSDGVIVRIDGPLARAESLGLPKTSVETDGGPRLAEAGTHEAGKSNSPPLRPIAAKSGALSSENRAENKAAKSPEGQALSVERAQVAEPPRSKSRGVLSRTNKKAGNATMPDKPATTADSTPAPSAKPASAKVAATSAKPAASSEPVMGEAPPVNPPKFPGQLTSFETRAVPQSPAASPTQTAAPVKRLPPPTESAQPTRQPHSTDAAQADQALPVLGITPKSTNWPHAWPLPASRP